jgi:hypothetical protein
MARWGARPAGVLRDPLCAVRRDLGGRRWRPGPRRSPPRRPGRAGTRTRTGRRAGSRPGRGSPGSPVPRAALRAGARGPPQVACPAPGRASAATPPPPVRRPRRSRRTPCWCSCVPPPGRILILRLVSRPLPEPVGVEGVEPPRLCDAPGVVAHGDAVARDGAHVVLGLAACRVPGRSGAGARSVHERASGRAGGPPCRRSSQAIAG